MEQADAAGNQKKRAAARQISKDDDPDAEEENQAGVSSSFQRASEAVLATRRIVKVRRTAAPATAAANPFANISIVPAPPEPAAASCCSLAPAATASCAEDKEAEAASQEKDVKVEEGVGSSGQGKPREESATEVNGNAEGVVAEVKVQAENGSSDKAATEEPERKEVTGPGSFQQHSSVTNAFGTFAGSLGTGFSNVSFSQANSTSTGLSSFAFGSSTLGAAGFGAAAAGAFPSLSTVFGKSNGGAPFQLFGSADKSTTSTAAVGSNNWGTVALQELHVETGEEKERVVFSSDATLFQFMKESGWKERGKGELKVNVSQDSARTARLVMRSKGNFRLLLNANLFPDMKLNRMDNRGVSFACINSAAEGQEGLISYAVKMRDAVQASEFMSSVESCKSRAQSSADLKTPENSPKASQEHPKPFEGSSTDHCKKQDEET